MSETRYLAKPRLKEIMNSFAFKSKYANQKEFAKAVGVKEPTISRFDTQARYDINTLISISKCLEMSIEDLFVIENNPDYKEDNTYQKPDILDILSEQFGEAIEIEYLKGLPRDQMRKVIAESVNNVSRRLSEKDINKLKVAEQKGKYDVGLERKYDDSDKSKSTSNFSTQYIKDYNSDESIEKLEKKLRELKSNN